MSYTCQQTRHEISDALDSNEGLAAAAVEHISGCGDCTRFREEVTTLGTKLARPVPPFTPASGATFELPEGFHDRVIAAVNLAEMPSKVVAFPKWVVPVCGAAAAVVLAFVALNKSDAPSSATGEPAIAKVDPAPAPTPVAPPSETGLPGSIEVPFDVAAIPAEAERRMTSALTREADAIAADFEKVREFFSSRVTVVSRIGL